ncbi:hypothetical protein RQP53_24015 [Paucibacter sp. APW11]|uniref:Lipoprotein n=1 Tax=Roseateles aquae TaxID=3077235 RepID=A0ABU3PIU1_9BURK|nr:hypothetical protein [Paucibacter sp. APW11]MDT9002369.1 hypothetical protein [Paucibacter sp. APW11]
MNRLTLLTHLLLIGLWLGCVLTEALFERALLGRGPAAELWLARLHWRVDLFVEIPAFSGVVLSGWLLLHQASGSTVLALKLGMAAVAVLANLVCVVLVWRRLQCAERGDSVGFAALDRWQHRLGAVVLLGLLGALALGYQLAA